jgi:Repeat of unknown function (DUF5648)
VRGIPFATVQDVATRLPPLPTLTNVGGYVAHTSVHVTFDPVDSAVDYRIFPLPEDADMDVTDPTVIRNAVYRCAGRMESSPMTSDDGALSPNPYSTVHARAFAGGDIEGYSRPTSESTLGHVFATPGADRTPVYALGDPDGPASEADYCFESGYAQSRRKTYTADINERQTLLATGWRDDGIAFYAPLSTQGVQPVFTLNHLYFSSAAERTRRSSAQNAGFSVLTNAQAGTLPLMRVFYSSVCGSQHDELVAGAARFEAAYRQGSFPLTYVRWSPIDKPTILVVEALASGCPYQGAIAARSIPAFGRHEAYRTLTDMASSSPIGEVFINGQYDGAARPRAIARSFIQVEPQPEPQMDFFESFDAPLSFSQPETLTDYPRGGTNVVLRGERFDIAAYELDTEPQGSPLLAAGTFLGQLWTQWADIAADGNGKVRIEPHQMAEVRDDTFLHATLTTTTVATRRRYPQIIIADTPRPVQRRLQPQASPYDKHAIVVQPIISWPHNFQIQYCNPSSAPQATVGWDVNAQCNYYGMTHSSDSAAESEAPVPPMPYAPAYSGVDRGNRLDVYLSSRRVYFFFEGQPYGCADFPDDARFPTGAAQVSFGDVFYHSEADIVDAGLSFIYPFHARHLGLDTRRNYDSFGFSSGVEAPAWNEELFPCRKKLKVF